jgi:GTP-binding protein EngB required for normal cell division
MSEDDKSFYEFIKDKNIPFVLIATKTDKLNQSEKAKMMKNVKEVFGEIDFIKASVDDARSIERIRETIVSLVLK